MGDLLRIPISKARKSPSPPFYGPEPQAFGGPLCPATGDVSSDRCCFPFCFYHGYPLEQSWLALRQSAAPRPPLTPSRSLCPEEDPAAPPSLPRSVPGRPAATLWSPGACSRVLSASRRVLKGEGERRGRREAVWH